MSIKLLKARKNMSQDIENKDSACLDATEKQRPVK